MPDKYKKDKNINEEIYKNLIFPPILNLVGLAFLYIYYILKPIKEGTDMKIAIGCDPNAQSAKGRAY